jgi:hypothetical protein
MNTLVRLSAEPTQTRVLITQGSRDIGKAILPPTSNAHRRATATLLEGLSLYMNERLCVVLSVDEWSASSDSLGILDALGHGQHSVFYEVAVAARLSSAQRRKASRVLRLPGSDFRDLRQLSWEWAQ